MFVSLLIALGRSRWPRGLRRGSGLLGLRVRIPPGAWMSVYCECCVLSGRGLCDGSIPRPEESYRNVSFSVIRCNSNPLHLQWVGRRGQTQKEGQKFYRIAKELYKVDFYFVVQPIGEHFYLFSYAAIQFFRHIGLANRITDTESYQQLM